MVWTDKCNDAYVKLKENLPNAPRLPFPNINSRFILDCDASHSSIGATFAQEDSNGNEIPVAFASRSLSKHEEGYCVTRKELLAILFFIQQFRPYLYGQEFIVRTNHQALCYLKQSTKPITSQYQSWFDILAEYNFQLIYRPGSYHKNADAMSRINNPMCTM